jgi:serine/threonine-protein kinase RsbW
MPERDAETAVLKEVKVTLRLEPEIEIEACEKACAVAEGMRMSPDKVDEIRMAVIEACINAVEHSSSRDGRLYLTLSVMGKKGGKVPTSLRIVVADRGTGFDPGKVVEPKIERKLHAVNKRGWGLQIIEGLMDEVVIDSNDDGTAVVMSKKAR